MVHHLISPDLEKRVPLLALSNPYDFCAIHCAIQISGNIQFIEHLMQ
jgi:hypothetical protein